MEVGVFDDSAHANDVFCCENCIINDGHDIDVPEEIEDPKDWLINLIKNY
jgi:hypothetical protein